MRPQIATPARLSDLSSARQALVRLCQAIDHGQILDLHIGADGEPLFSPEPQVIVEIKLDGNPTPRADAALADFVLRNEVVRLLDHIDTIRTGRIQKIEVRAGLPKRVLIRASLREVAR
jgi:hypothetical protein